MCSSPIIIPNPYYNRGLDFEHKGKRVRLKLKGRFDYLHDTFSHHIQVPCGKCPQCLSMRQGFFNQRVQMESLRSELFFFTLTYANRGLPFSVIGNYKVNYPDYRHIQLMFKRLRNLYPHKIRMFVVSEYGGQKGRPHFHGFIAVEREDIIKYYRGSPLLCEKVLYRDVLANWKINRSSSDKFPLYMPLCDFVVKGRKHTYELRRVIPIPGHDNDLSFYLSKYLLKPNKQVEKLLSKINLDITLSDDQRKQLISLIKPRSVMSKDFGSYKCPEVSRHIKFGLSRCSDYPSFFDINSGKSMLLSPYYRKRFVTLDMKFEKFWKYLHDVQYLDVPQSIDSYNPELLGTDIISDINYNRLKFIQKDKRFSRIRNKLSKL